MYKSIIKDVIAGGGYDLPALLEKIETLWLRGELTADECEELKEQARAGASAQNSVDILLKLQELETRIKKLEAQGDSTEAAAEEYVAGKWYYAGDKCRENGIDYVCTAPDGVVCVWSPSAYPAYWNEVTA